MHSIFLFISGDFKDTEAASTENVCALKVFLQDNKKDISDIAFTATLAFLYLYKAIYGKAGRYIIFTSKTMLCSFLEYSDCRNQNFCNHHMLKTAVRGTKTMRIY